MYCNLVGCNVVLLFNVLLDCCGLIVLLDVVWFVELGLMLWFVYGGVDVIIFNVVGLWEDIIYG